MDWGEVIRRVREIKNLTQQNLADELKVDKSSVVRWEQEGKIKTQQLEKIAKVFKMPIRELYTYYNNPSLLEDPITYYKSKKKVQVTIELDGNPETLDNWMNTLKKLNAALA